ncbi:hypothetical protein Tco_0338195, partial [Tanacetum coccineum]
MNVNSSVDEASIADGDEMLSEYDKSEEMNVEVLFDSSIESNKNVNVDKNVVNNVGSNDSYEHVVSNEGNNRVCKNTRESYAKIVKRDIINVNNKLNFVPIEISEE